MSAYRFCRTDDIGLLVDALNGCWAPHFPGEPLATPASFKRWIRDLQVWCSSCMVAFAGRDPIGVLIGAKRPSATLIYRIAVHPDHLRRGHGRHLLSSLGSKLAILGPPRIVAEVPESLETVCRFFEACGYAREAVLTDYAGGPNLSSASAFIIPITVDDLAANGLLGDTEPESCWERSVETLTARKTDLAGLAVASDERIEAYLLFVDRRIVALRSVVEDGGARVQQLLSRLGVGTLTFPKVHPGEMSRQTLEALGFRPIARHLQYATRARAD